MALDYRGPFLLLFAVDSQVGSLLHVTMRDCPLTPEEFAVTSVLNLTGPTRVGELRALTGLRPSSMSNYLRRFEARGVVRRRTDASDRRASLVSLTAKGRRQTLACFPGFSAAIGAFQKALADEGVQEADLLDALEGASRALTLAQEAVASPPTSQAPRRTR
jgi:DNA-binding MarR family transcriptional regulator